MNTPVPVIHGLKTCDTCRKALKWLTAQGIAHEFVDYREHPASQTELRRWASQVGGWDKLVNRSSTTWRGLPETSKQPAGEADWLALILAHPQLVKRPVLVTADGIVSVGFSEKRWGERLASARAGTVA